MAGLRQAFKEWAGVCRALGEGRQALILRKGGIAEAGGRFRVEHDRFWLYPTYVHQQEVGIVAEARPLLGQALAERPPAGTLRLGLFADVAGVYQVSELAQAERLAGLHVWSAEAVRARFAHRSPGLFVLAVRVWRAPAAFEVPESPAYAGCKSWVELDRELPTDGAVPVLADGDFAALREKLDRLLPPVSKG
jgi:hypothetical protein